MKSRIDTFFEESTQTFPASMPRNERFLTRAEVEELLRDLPVHVVDFRQETPREHSRIA